MTQIHTTYQALTAWLDMIKRSRSKATWSTYRAASEAFKREVMRRDKPLKELSAHDYEAFVQALKAYTPRTEKLYATIVGLFFEYLSAKNLRRINTDTIRFTRRTETRKVPKRLRKMDMPAVSEIANNVAKIKPGKDLYLHRAKTLVLFLCHGLRAAEAVSLTLRNLNPAKLKGTVIGKGDKEGRFIFNRDCLNALTEYRSLHGHPTPYLFISHSRRHAKSTPKPIDTDTARRDVDRIVDVLLSDAPNIKITPHQFRHYFVTKIWREHDLKTAQTLARHNNIATTENYIHDEED